MSRLRTTDRATGDDLDVLDFYERETERLHRAIDEPPAVVAIRQRYPEWKARLLIQAFYRRHPDHDTNYARRAFADGGYGRDGETPITPAKGGRKRRGRDMRKAEIKVGAVYMAKVTRTVVRRRKPRLFPALSGELFHLTVRFRQTYPVGTVAGQTATV